jgi:hypothetical protein
MRVFGLSCAVVLLTFITAACPHQHERGGQGALEYPCGQLYNSDQTKYDAVTEEMVSGSCEVTFHVDDSQLDNVHHPEVRLSAKRGDQVILEGSSGFRYSIEPDPPRGLDETKCNESPVDFDPQSGEGLHKHTLGKVRHGKDSPDECHYKMSFIHAETQAEIDPHIVIGSGRVGGKSGGSSGR